jgi:hypothetical protein
MLFNLDPIAPSQPTAADSTQHTLPNLPDLDKDKNLNKNKEENIEQ